MLSPYGPLGWRVRRLAKGSGTKLNYLVPVGLESFVLGTVCIVL